jgi:radical SAM superfamily enzyme
MVIQRVSGDAPPEFLVAPQWCLEKQALLQAVQHELERRDSWQGRFYQPVRQLCAASSVTHRGVMSLPMVH